ncbi:hypothetical protein KIPB_006911, partial [Kipferlia bialata]|eukprot:g6911.t1
MHKLSSILPITLISRLLSEGEPYISAAVRALSPAEQDIVLDLQDAHMYLGMKTTQGILKTNQLAGEQSRADVAGRTLVGSLELCVRLLRENNDPLVKGWLCGMVARLARNDENNRILTEYGVLPLVSELALSTENPLVRENVAECIAALSPTRANRLKFSELGVLPALVNFLKKEGNSKDASAAAVKKEMARSHKAN